MRIVHVIGHYIPGLGYEENCLPQQQAGMGHEVFLVTSNRLPPDFAQVAAPPPPASGSIQGTITVYAEDGVTPLARGSVNVSGGNAYQLALSGGE